MVGDIRCLCVWPFKVSLLIANLLHNNHMPSPVHTSLINHCPPLCVCCAVNLSFCGLYTFHGSFILVNHSFILFSLSPNKSHYICKKQQLSGYILILVKFILWLEVSGIYCMVCLDRTRKAWCVVLSNGIFPHVLFLNVLIVMPRSFQGSSTPIPFPITCAYSLWYPTMPVMNPFCLSITYIHSIYPPQRCPNRLVLETPPVYRDGSLNRLNSLGILFWLFLKHPRKPWDVLRKDRHPLPH